MKFLRLPANTEDEPQYWQWGSSQKMVVLLPGDALLSESLSIPPGVHRRSQIKQWLNASPHLCQLRPEKDQLLLLEVDGEYCYYWAVERQLWSHWCELARRYAPGCRWMPDWMLLPEPQDSRPFVLKANDSILFRYEKGCGGALPVNLHHMMDSLQPRWLSIAGKGLPFPISSTFLTQQVSVQSRGWPVRLKLPSLKNLQSMLMTISAAFFIWQSTGAAWLIATRQPPENVMVKQKTVTRKAPASALASALTLLDSIQQSGPVNFDSLTLSQQSLLMTLSSPVECNTLSSRMKTLPLQPVYHTRDEGCDLVLKGVLP